MRTRNSFLAFKYQRTDRFSCVALIPVFILYQGENIHITGVEEPTTSSVYRGFWGGYDDDTSEENIFL